MAAALSDDNFAMVAKLALTAPVPWRPFLFYFSVMQCWPGKKRESKDCNQDLMKPVWCMCMNFIIAHDGCAVLFQYSRKVQLIAMMPSTYLDISY